MRRFTQVSEVTGECLRVPRNQKPVAELTLEGDRYIVGFAWSESPEPYTRAHDERKTSDWHWTATVVAPL